MIFELRSKKSFSLQRSRNRLSSVFYSTMFENKRKSVLSNLNSKFNDLNRIYFFKKEIE